LKQFFALLLCITTIAPNALPLQQTAQAPVSPAPLQGFFTASAQAEREWETKFRAALKPENLRESMRVLSAHPHHVGSAWDKQNAEWMLARFREWGWDAHIESFDVLFPTPKERRIELLEPVKFVAKMQEPAVAGDATSAQQAEQLPTYNAYSIDGDVTAPLVYVNYGTRDDYEQLYRMGISVKGAIVIVRYGGAWRGIKPKVAAEHGAVGCIIYSDPSDDGYADADVYPGGAGRNKDSVQRGAVTDTFFSGDPLTPGWGSVPGAKRLAIKDSPLITKIPVLPISYSDAEPLLTAIKGRVVPDAWHGGLPITYHVGPGPAKVHLVMKSNWDTKPVYDVIAKLPGSVAAEQWVLRGNHHDAWVNGASDPLSGMVAELEEARVMGELYKQGWRPKRTIIYAAWDGEEPGLIGSTEFLETHLADLQQHAVAYLNSDSNGRGFLRMSGSHSLERFINGVAKDVEDPEKQIPVWKRLQLSRIATASGSEERNEARNRADLRIRALGDGSDYASFLDHGGIASMNLGFGGEGRGGQYHSIYDDFAWFTKYDDPKFEYGRALAQTAGTAIMRLADSDLLPFEFVDQAETFSGYVKDLQKLLKTKQDEATERTLALEEGAFNAVSDPQEPTLAPPPLDRPPAINFAVMENGMEALTQAARRYDQAAKKISEQTLTADELKAINEKLYRSERFFLNTDGLPNRPWFRHQIYAPGAYTGYAVKTMPMVRESLEQRQWAQAEKGALLVGDLLQKEAAWISDIAAELDKHTAGK
jgi:N-acetylated-alpha-linked acidic dipeptidase